MIITTKINIDLKAHSFAPVVNAVQGDCNTRQIAIALNVGGSPWQIPEGTTASVRYRKSDGSKGYYDTLADGSPATSIAANTVFAMLAPQALNVPGRVIAQIELTQGTKVIRTFGFFINVEEDPAAGVVEPENYVNWLQWMKTEVATEANNVLTAAKESGEFDGAPGYTPVRGTDYYTDADKQEMVSLVLSALPTWEGGSY